LKNYLIANGYNYNAKTTGNYIAASMASKTDWFPCSWFQGSPGYDASSNNRTGFSGLPVGIRGRDGGMAQISGFGTWWCSRQLDTAEAYCRSLESSSATLWNSTMFKKAGCSIRLISDY
jgi:uncharacterized protein (TIGR02145 family)